jgi:hypothetical protein
MKINLLLILLLNNNVEIIYLSSTNEKLYDIMNIYLISKINNFSINHELY